MNNVKNKTNPIIVIDHNAGFCFGVVNAIAKAEELLKHQSAFYCLGDIVHNTAEVNRLTQSGMRVIQKNQLESVKNSVVLFRAHGEPPASYEQALKNNNTLIDGTCPVVLKLQERIKQAGERMLSKNGQVIIFGKASHPEVLGLAGQILQAVTIIEDETQFSKYNPELESEVFAQTTSNPALYKKLCDYIATSSKAPFKINDTICRQVSGRALKMEQFGKSHDVVVFVGGRESSNAKQLFKLLSQHNNRSYFIETESDLNPDWFLESKTIGITGATSTPLWLMEQVAASITSFTTEM